MVIKQQKKLLETADGRTLKLNDAMAALAQQIEELNISAVKLKKNSAFKEQIVTLVLHDIRSPLRFLDSITDNIYTTSIGLVPDNTLNKLMHLNAAVKEISAYAQRLLVWITVQQNEFSEAQTNVSLNKIFQEKTAVFQQLAKQKGITLYCTVAANDKF